MDAFTRNSCRIFSTALVTSALLMSTGCAAFKHHRGKSANAQTGQGASTNRYASSISNQAQKTANTNAAPSQPVDSTAQNKTEANQDTLTPMDQGDSDIDRRISQDLRRAIMTGQGGDPFSFTAKNIKIITVNSEMTLRGVVGTPSEKERIESLAKQVPGVTKVYDQLKVKGANRP